MFELSKSNNKHVSVSQIISFTTLTLLLFQMIRKTQETLGFCHFHNELSRLAYLHLARPGAKGVRRSRTVIGSSLL